MRFDCTLDPPEGPSLGLIALQADETIERDFRRLFDTDTRLMVSRVPSAPEVTPATLQQMDSALTGAASLLPRPVMFDVVAYGCTSASAQLGPARVAELIRAGVDATSVTEPLSALIAACRALGISRLALLSPYVAEVSERLRSALRRVGIETPLVGSFEQAIEGNVVRISARSMIEAATTLARQGGVEGLFLSCTNLRTLDVIAPLEAQLGMPVLSSNQVLAWHMSRLSRTACGPARPGRLFGAAGNDAG